MTKRQQHESRRRALQSARDARKRTGRKLPWFNNPPRFAHYRGRVAIDEALR